MVDNIENIDRKIFLVINDCHNAFLDSIMYQMSNPFFWIPVYLLLIYLLLKRYKVKNIGLVLLFAALVVTLCDRSSVMLFKNVFLRYRPCHNLEIKDSIHLINNYCGGTYGFVSSHATNFFGIATFCVVLLTDKLNWKIFLLFLWPAAISYSRIYLGVHYPADVVGGGLLGIVIGAFVGLLGKKIIQKRLAKIPT